MVKRIRDFCRDERGMTFAFVGIGLMTFMAATTLAIDVGMFLEARTQAQNSADAGALAGVTALVYNSWSDRTASGPAVQSTLSAAHQNTVMMGVPSVQPSDVTFPTDPSGVANRVRVNVYRTASRGNPVTTLIGPLLGIPTIDIAATATAEASPAGGMTCVKPFIIPDKWIENTNPPWNINTSTYDHYDNRGNVLPIHDDYDPYMGYSMADKGTILVLRAGSGSNIQPTFYFSWSMPGNTTGEIGGDWYRDNIANCNTTVIYPGDVAIQEPGNMEGPTIQGLQGLWDRDPNARWDDVNNTYISDQHPSPRVFPIPLYNPDQYDYGKKTGRNATLNVTGFIGFFLDHISGNAAYGRIFPITGVSAATSPTPTAPLAYVIRLVQ